MLSYFSQFLIDSMSEKIDEYITVNIRRHVQELAKKLLETTPTRR